MNSNNGASEPNIEKIVEALNYIPALDRDVWLQVGMALHHFSSGGKFGQDLWDAWSKTSPHKFVAREQQRAWTSFKGEGITIRTVFDLAQAHGADLAELGRRRRARSQGGQPVEAAGVDNSPTRADTPTDSTSQASGDWQPIVPVPPDAPRYNLPEGAQTWHYTDDSGQLVMIMNRVDRSDGNKSFWPVTYCKCSDGRREWHQLGLKDRRPLYRLEQLSADADRPALVVEGEKSADAASALFPGFVVTTSSGGASSAGASDWSPCTSRRVVIWPDNDEPGQGYAREVGRVLYALGAEVFTVDIPANWPVKWDLADPLPDGVFVEDLERMLANATPFVPDDQPPQGGAGFEGDDDQDMSGWPQAPAKAMRGLAGDIARAATRSSEADSMAVLATTLVYFGVAAGRGAKLLIGDTEHHARIFVAIVGASSRARKGTSASPVRRLFKEAGCLGGNVPRLTPGPLSSGEGLINEIRDASEVKNDDGEPVDPGMPDKRLMILDSELASGLRSMKRDGNTLGTILRSAWDGTDLAPITKYSRIRASEPHIGIVAHITRHELLRLLQEAEIWGGTGNRFLWVLARRQQLVARPLPMDATIVAALASRLAGAISFAQTVGEVALSDKAIARWEEVYVDVSRDFPGEFGVMTSRAEAQVMRLSLIYALLDESPVIELEHVEAALAFWGYCRASVAFIFDRQQNPLEKKVLKILGEGPHSTTDLHKAMKGHVRAANLAAVLKELVARGVIDQVDIPRTRGPGRGKTIWQLRDLQ